MKYPGWIQDVMYTHVHECACQLEHGLSLFWSPPHESFQQFQHSQWNTGVLGLRTPSSLFTSTCIFLLGNKPVWGEIKTHFDSWVFLKILKSKLHCLQRYQRWGEGWGDGDKKYYSSRVRLLTRPSQWIATCSWLCLPIRKMETMLKIQKWCSPSTEHTISMLIITYHYIFTLLT